MTPAEVFAVEVKQFLGEDGLQTLVPQVVAQTSTPKQPPGKTWNEATFFTELESEAPESIESAAKIMAWANERGLEISWGKGRQTGSFTPTLSYDGAVHRVFSVWTSGHLQMHFGDLKKRPPFDNQDARVELLAKVNEASGAQLPEDASKYPSFLVSELSDLSALLSAFDWAMDTIRSEAAEG